MAIVRTKMAENIQKRAASVLVLAQCSVSRIIVVNSWRIIRIRFQVLDRISRHIAMRHAFGEVIMKMVLNNLLGEVSERGGNRDSHDDDVNVFLSSIDSALLHRS